MANYLVDSHCHLHDQEWFTPEQAEKCLAAARADNVQQVVCIGTDPEDSKAARDFALAHENVFWTFGIHPEYAERRTGQDSFVAFSEPFATNGERAEQSSPVTTGRTAASSEKVQNCQSLPIAIGEIGLDYHYPGYRRDAQIKLFEQMLQLAQDQNLPVSLHIREAFADAFAILNNFPHITSVVHSFTGNKRELRQALERGFYIGVNGLATYTTPALPPLERIILETDAPFLTPVPFRGTINEPRYIAVIAAYLAEKLGVAEAKIVEQTTYNASQIFKLPEYQP